MEKNHFDGVWTAFKSSFKKNMGKDNRAVEYLCRLREAGSALLDPFNDSIIKAD